MSEEALRKLALQVRNWGKWGPDDELGTLNYITPDTIAEAGRLATTGKVFALGVPLQREGPQSGTRARFNPIHAMFRDGGDRPKTPEEVKEAQGYGGSDDWIVMPLQCVTQWDSLAHIFYEGKMWNCYSADLVTSTGAAKNSIDKTNSKLAGRGVLLDVARHKGVRALEPGYAITVADLEATAAAPCDVVDGEVGGLEQPLGLQHALGDEPLQGRAAGQGPEPAVEGAAAHVGAGGEHFDVELLVEVLQGPGDDLGERVVADLLR